jgi:Tol biopolymer transport system component
LVAFAVAATTAMAMFIAPVNLSSLNSAAGESYPSLSADGLTLYFVSTRNGSDDIWFATRPDASSPFGAPMALPGFNTGGAENGPSISSDGLSLYFNTDVFTGAGFGLADIYVSTRPDLSSSFGLPSPVLGGVSLPFPSHDQEPYISKDGLSLLFASNRSGGAGDFDIWVASRPDFTSPFNPPVNVAEINSPFEDSAPTLTADGLTIYFHSTRPGGVGGFDLWMATRPDPSSVFGPPVPVSLVNTPASEGSPDISGDGSVLVFSSNRPGGVGSSDIWLAHVNRRPVADAGADVMLSCASPTGTQVTLDGSGSRDPDGHALTYTWTGPFPEGGGTLMGMNPTVTLPLGTSTITLVVNDGHLDSAPDAVTITIAVDVEGLLPPLAALVPEGQMVPLPSRAFRRGSTLPLRLRLWCGNQSLTEADVPAPRIFGLVRNSEPVDLTTIDPDSGEANDNTLFFRFSDGNWVYNLSTGDLVTGTYVIAIELPDRRRVHAAFVLK